MLCSIELILDHATLWGHKSVIPGEIDNGDHIVTHLVLPRMLAGDGCSVACSGMKTRESVEDNLRSESAGYLLRL